MLKIIVAGLLMAGGPETLAQNPPEVKWMSVEEALKDPVSAHAVKIKAGTDYAYQVQQLAPERERSVFVKGQKDRDRLRVLFRLCRFQFLFV